MLKKITLAATAVAMLAVSAPVAHAGVVKYGCGFDSVAQQDVTGGQDTFTGAAYGYAIFDDDADHTLRCVVKVDGGEQSSTPVGSGQHVVTAAGQVVYDAAEGAAVDMCTEIDGVEVACGPADSGKVPPDQFWEAIDLIFATLDPVFTEIDNRLAPVFTAIEDAEKAGIDPTVCPILASFTPGWPDLGIIITPEGDTTLPDPIGPFWDCPEYGNLF